MARRKSKVLPPKGPKKPKKEHADALRAPNHLVPLGMPKEPSKRVDTLRYPLLRLSLPETVGGGTPGRLAFFDKLHALVCADDREPGAPPSWMDPEVFMRMVKQDQRLVGKKRPSPNLLKEVLADVFENQYLVYTLEQFELVLPLLTEWLSAHYAYLNEET